jgi:hypothetical protein
MGPVVAAHYKLMSTRYQFQSICMVELFRDVLPERVASTSGRDAPAAAVIGVRPQQVADGSFVGHFLHSVQLTNLVEGVDRRRETSVETEYLSLDHCSQGQVIEQFSESLPHIGISVLAQALIVETIPILRS